MLKFSSFLFFFVAAISLKYSHALSEGEKSAFLELMRPKAKECLEELGLDESLIEEARKTHQLEPCFLACLLKKNNVMSDGMINEDAAVEEVKMLVHEESEIERLSEIAQDCAAEANKADADGECERAKAFGLCIKDKASA